MSESKDPEADTFEYYAVRFKIEDRPLKDDEDGGDLVQEFTGETIRETEANETVVGKVRGARIDLGGALDRELSFYDIFDQNSEELCEYYAALFDPTTGDFRDELALRDFGDILVVHSVEIIPEYRGLNLGLLTMLQTVKTFGSGCALAAIKPFPLQFSGKFNRENQRQFTKDQNKLRAYWQKFGFLRIGRTEYYYFDLTRRLPRPTKFLVPAAARLGGRSMETLTK